MSRNSKFLIMPRVYSGLAPFCQPTPSVKRSQNEAPFLLGDTGVSSRIPMTSHTCSAPIGGELLRCTEAERTQPLTWARGGPSLATVMDVLQAVPSLENFKISYFKNFLWGSIIIALLNTPVFNL